MMFKLGQCAEKNWRKLRGFDYLAKDTGIQPIAISEILRGKRRITPRTGLRLVKFFGVSEGYFVRLQVQYEMDLVKEAEGNEIDQICAVA